MILGLKSLPEKGIFAMIMKGKITYPKTQAYFEMGESSFLVVLKSNRTNENEVIKVNPKINKSNDLNVQYLAARKQETQAITIGR